MIKTKETTHKLTDEPCKSCGFNLWILENFSKDIHHNPPIEWVELICRMCGDTKNIIKTDITYIKLIGYDYE